jgi:hypothetical protein
MSDEQKHTEQKTNQNKMAWRKWNLKQFVDGNIFLKEPVKKELGFILFLVFLFLLNINNRYRYEKLLVDIIQSQIEIKELRDRSIHYAAELMSLSRESKVKILINEKKLGLKEITEPPKKILVKKTKDE